MGRLRVFPSRVKNVDLASCLQECLSTTTGKVALSLVFCYLSLRKGKPSPALDPLLARAGTHIGELGSPLLAAGKAVITTHTFDFYSHIPALLIAGYEAQETSSVSVTHSDRKSQAGTPFLPLSQSPLAEPQATASLESSGKDLVPETLEWVLRRPLYCGEHILY